MHDLVDEVSGSVVNISTVANDVVASSAAPAGPEAEAPSRENMPDWMKKFLEQHAPEGYGGSDSEATIRSPLPGPPAAGAAQPVSSWYRVCA